MARLTRVRELRASQAASATAPLEPLQGVTEWRTLALYCWVIDVDWRIHGVFPGYREGKHTKFRLPFEDTVGCFIVSSSWWSMESRSYWLSSWHKSESVLGAGHDGHHVALFGIVVAVDFWGNSTPSLQRIPESGVRQTSNKPYCELSNDFIIIEHLNILRKGIRIYLRIGPHLENSWNVKQKKREVQKSERY